MFIQTDRQEYRLLDANRSELSSLQKHTFILYSRLFLRLGRVGGWFKFKVVVKIRIVYKNFNLHTQNLKLKPDGWIFFGG